MSPESFNDGVFNAKSDMWMLGVCMWGLGSPVVPSSIHMLAEIFTYANMPWPGVGDSDIIESVNAGVKLERPTGVPLCCYDLMLACWHIDPEDRPTAKELIKMMDQLEGDDFLPPATDGPVSESFSSNKNSVSSATSGSSLFVSSCCVSLTSDRSCRCRKDEGHRHSRVKLNRRRYRR
jgi:hypothetical protein